MRVPGKNRPNDRLHEKHEKFEGKIQDKIDGLLRRHIHLREKELLVIVWIGIGLVLMALAVPYADPQAVLPLRYLVALVLWVAGAPIMVAQYRRRR